MSDSLWPHEPQHTRPPCPSPTPGVHPDPCPSSCWCHATISSSVIPFSSCPQSLPASRPFQMSQLFASGGQSIGVSASTSVPPMNTQDWSPLGWTGWIQTFSLSSCIYTTIFLYQDRFPIESSLEHLTPVKILQWKLTNHYTSLKCSRITENNLFTFEWDWSFLGYSTCPLSA